MFEWLKRHTQAKAAERSLPTVKFDFANVTATVRADIRASIEKIEDIDRPHVEPIYYAAVEAISLGGDLSLLTNAIIKLNIPGVARARAASMARWLSRSSMALINDERYAAIGIVSAKWLYSGAPCHSGRASPSVAQIRQDTAHRLADGTIYSVGKGVLIDGEWTLPGRAPDCKCIANAIIPGVHD